MTNESKEERFKKAMIKKYHQFVQGAKDCVISTINWIGFTIEMLLWVAPSLLLDLYIPIFVFVGGGTKFYNSQDPKKSLGFQKNIVLMEAMKTFP